MNKNLLTESKSDMLISYYKKNKIKYIITKPVKLTKYDFLGIPKLIKNLPPGNQIVENKITNNNQNIK